MVLAYADPDERVYVKDVRRQIAWFRSPGMLKGDGDPETLLDRRRYIIPLRVP